jgi:hypothetical protein
MALRSGIRGVTIDDVADVAENGSSVMRGGYTFTRPSQTPLPSVQDIIGRMTATPLNTAGQKYSGYPTATAREAAVLGSLAPFYSLGDYAAQLAKQQTEPLITRAEERAAGRAELAASAAQQLADAQARLRGMSIGQRLESADLGPFTYSTRGSGVGLTQDDVAQAQADRDLAAYGAAMAARNKYAFAQPTYSYDPQTGEYRFTSTPTAIALQDTMETDIRNQPEYADIAPLEQLAADIQAVPRYQLAQQMATQYFGMDPALAAGTFTPEVDIDYMDMMTDYQTAQNLAAGIDPNASTEDILLRLDPSGQRLLQYQEQIAAEAERKAFEGARNAEEEAFDLNLEVSTGYNVKQAAGTDFALSTARGYLNDADFLKTVDNSVDSMQETQVFSPSDRKQLADRIAAQYLDEAEDPVGARILLNILYGFEFVTPTANFNLG